MNKHSLFRVNENETQLFLEKSIKIVCNFKNIHYICQRFLTIN